MSVTRAATETHIKTLLSGISLLIAAQATADAAGLSSESPAPVFNVPGYSWTGAYLGGNLGGARASSDPRTTTTLGSAGSYFFPASISAIAAVGAQNIRTSGIADGAQGGYNWQTGRLVLGLEADFSYVGLKGTATGSAIYACCAPTGFSINSSARSDWLVTARPRIGAAVDNVLFFVTGGVAVTDLHSAFMFGDDNSSATASGSQSKTIIGGTRGGGVEAGFSSHWTIKVEYQYVNFGNISAASANLTSSFGPSPLNVFTHSTDLNARLYRLGVNYRF
jgi:outer membrane immunogenic protein